MIKEPLMCSQGGIPYNKPHLDAKDAEIERLCVELNRLKKAAIPFAAYDWVDAEYDWVDADLEDDSCKLTRHSGPITVGHWRALRAALSPHIHDPAAGE